LAVIARLVPVRNAHVKWLAGRLSGRMMAEMQTDAGKDTCLYPTDFPIGAIVPAFLHQLPTRLVDDLLTAAHSGLIPRRLRGKRRQWPNLSIWLYQAAIECQGTFDSRPRLETSEIACGDLAEPVEKMMA